MAALPSEILLYTSEDGETRIDVRLVDETVWLSQAQMAELFDKDVRTINEHVGNVFDDVARNLACALDSNHPEFPDGCRPVAFAIVKDVADMFVDRADVLVEQLRHLRLH